MKKLLLCGGLLLSSLFNANAQTTCTFATTIPVTGGTYTSPAITGAFPSGGTICTFGNSSQENAADPKAVWYKITPTSNGVLTVDAGVGGTQATDTRLRLLSGTCGNFACVAFNDDISYNDDPATDDFRSRLSNIPVVAGTTYYIVFDNRWSAGAVTFNVSFTAQSCFAPTNFTIPTGGLTTNSLTLNWNAPTLGTPTGYQIEYGPENFDQGAGTTINPTGTTATISQLTPGTAYELYIRTHCGDTSYSQWVGPLAFDTLFGPANLPYTNGFDNDTNLLDGATIVSGWNVGAQTGTILAHTPTNFLFTNTAATPVNSWMFSRGLNLTANTTVTLIFQTRYLGGATDNASLRITLGADTTSANHTNVIQTFTIPGAQASWVQRTVTFTPATTGVYYIGFNNNSGVTSGNWSLLLDSMNITTTAGSNDFLASKLAIYPNPANDVVNIANADNIIINGAQIVDLNGRTVKVAKFNGVSEAQINISDLASGVYMMTVSSDQGSLTKKIVKQ